MQHASRFETHYFDAYAYDTIWSLAHFYELQQRTNETNLKQLEDRIDFLGATVSRDSVEDSPSILRQGRVRFLHGERLGEIFVEQYVGK